ncbi:MAG: toxin TcdB middle/N-terminal domain-containing protein [Kofleriaceae bacterium]
MQLGGPLSGYFERTQDASWEPFRAFAAVPNLDLGDASVRMVDLTGDGHADVLVANDAIFTWYPSLAKAGFADAVRTPQAGDAPRLVTSDPMQAIFLADMSGDGLADLIRIRNGEVCYWPNLGYGKFGAKITMDGAPWFDAPGTFDHGRLRIADLDGSGTSDLVYLGGDGVALYFNHGGNGFAPARWLRDLPPYDSQTAVSIVDLFGNGTACLVWSAPTRPMCFVDLMSGHKPDLLVGFDNHLGSTTEITYAPSTRFYLADRAAGRPWLTRLNFPVHCVERVTVRDKWRGTTFTASYSYHHGFFDGDEREFRGFGRVEQVDIESGVAAGDQPPIKTVTWFRTGADVSYAGEYRTPVAEVSLASEIPADREAVRAAKGTIARREVYELSTATGEPIRLISTESHACDVRELQPHVFLTTELATIAYQYELRLGEPADPRITHTLVLAHDRFGRPVETVSAAYPRATRHIDPVLPAGAEDAIADVQHETHVSHLEQRFTDELDTDLVYRLPAPCETLTCELTGLPPGILRADDLRALALRNRAVLPYHLRPTGGIQKRLVEQVRITYFDDALAGARPLGQQGARALVYETSKLALTDALLAAVFDTRITLDVATALGDPARSGYRRDGDAYWIPSGIAFPDPAHFYLATRYEDPFGNLTRVAYEHDLLEVSRIDAVANTSTVELVDYRVVAPVRIRDANDNVTAVAYDALGLPTAFAVLAGGDSLTSFGEPSASFFTAAYDEAAAAALLGDATARHVYDLGQRTAADGSVVWAAHPASTVTISRERHRGDAPASRLQVAFEYTDAGGATLVTKTKAEPAPEQTTLRWIASGKTVVNNKGKPIAQYEPYVSSNEHRFEEVVAVGTPTTLTYDALGRVVRTTAPDGSYTRVDHAPWQVTRFDANDTINEPGNRWFATRSAATAPAAEHRAAAAALAHANTPAIAYLDTLGREVIVLQHDRSRAPGAPAPTERRTVQITVLDSEGKPLAVRDARDNLVVEYVRASVPGYDIAGNRLYESGMDYGERWMLADASGQPMFVWAARRLETRNDALRRVLEVRRDDGAILERLRYGEGQPDDRARNLRGQLFEHFDASGCMRFVAYDHAARVLETERQLVADDTAPAPDWRTATLSTETFVHRAQYDALGRTLIRDAWHRAGGRVAVHESTYNERGLLATEAIVIDGTRTLAIEAITYDAKGLRTLVRRGNGTRSRYTYDAESARLVQLRTTRPSYDPRFPSRVGQFRDPDVVQNLFYTYDAVGNVLEILDDAFRPAFFANQVIEPIATYTYDALYRLIAATGREHAGAVVPNAVEPPPLAVTFPVGSPDAADQRNYTETFRYDEVGNLVEHAHLATTGWTRRFAYEAATNRLASTTLGTATTTYAFDARGNMLGIATWDDRDLVATVPRGGGGTVYYQYDADKRRTRKASYTQQGAKAWERLDLGETEIYRRFSSGAVVEEIETHHVMDGEQRVVLVEDVRRTDRTGAPTGVLLRYQYTNHLGSSCLELDAAGAVISYEEYHPYGTTAYRTARGQIDAPKRYRFTGMERDDESGLSYHGARYYAPWLARWCSCDPSGLVDGTNLYAYARNSPIRFTDTAGSDSDDSTTSVAALLTARRAAGAAQQPLMSYAVSRDAAAYWRYHGMMGDKRASFLADYIRAQPGVEEVFRESTSKQQTFTKQGRERFKSAKLGGPTTAPADDLKYRRHDLNIRSSAAPSVATTLEVSTTESFQYEGKKAQMQRSAESVGRGLYVGNSEKGFFKHAADIPQESLIPKGNTPAPGWSDPKTGLNIKGVPPAEVPPRFFTDVKPAPRSAAAALARTGANGLAGLANAAGPAMFLLQATEQSPHAGPFATYDEDVLEWKLGLRATKPKSVQLMEDMFAAEREANLARSAAAAAEAERIRAYSLEGASKQRP